MKRIALAGLSALTLVGTMAGTASAQTYDHRDGRGDYNRNDRNDRNDRADRNDRNNNGRYDNRRDNNQWSRQWRRGDRLPSGYEGRYRQVDWRREHFRAPPRGYRYVRDDRGETLLVGIATGVILGVIFNNF